MSAATVKKNTLVRVYKKESRSPWADASTVLLLADIISTENDVHKLAFESYIYLHKCEQGTVLGISISKKLLSESSHAESKYLTGKDMYKFLQSHTKQIIYFTEHYESDFQELFMLAPRAYFKCAKKHWKKHIEKK